jgi:putative oxidoreductase
VTGDRAIALYARLALGTAFLSAVASRSIGWGGGTWDGTVQWARTDVLAFAPAALVPVLVGAATACELALGILLIAGVWRRPVALAASGLLAMFAIAMAVSAGIKSPLDYSVFSASAGALLLAREP